jgi:3'-phosphoadenosine 5'-phosphosulfate sulfotransferase (PAPS reductase)/FAD synthetase
MTTDPTTPADETEAAVDAMLVRGKEIMLEAFRIAKPIALFALYSGGNDSIVSTHFACTNYRPRVLHCGTTIGIQQTKGHVRGVCSRFGWDLLMEQAIVQGPPSFSWSKDAAGKRIKVPFDPFLLPSGAWTDGATAYEEAVLNYGFPGPGQHGRMYQRLKERSLDRVVSDAKKDHERNRNVLLVSGIRHDESAIRAGYKSAIQKDGCKVWVNPFYFQTAADFEAYRHEFGLPRNPVSKRIGISGECLCGAFAKPGELELVRSVEPETAAAIDELSARVQANGFPWGWGERPPAWWIRDQRDRKSGQLGLLDDGPTFQPMCVGCPHRRTA